jgi:hypothetical protein
VTLELEISDLVQQMVEQLARRGKVGARITQGVVVDVDPSGETCTVKSSGIIPGVRWLRDGYLPVINDAVFLLRNGPDMFILGRTLGEARQVVEPDLPDPQPTECGLYTAAALSVTSSTNVISNNITEIIAHPDIGFNAGTDTFSPSARWWNISVRGFWAANATGLRAVNLWVNGATESGLDSRPGLASGVTLFSSFVDREFNGTDTFQFRNSQTSGSTLNLTLSTIRITPLTP